MKKCKKCGEQDPSKFTEKNQSGLCKKCQAEYARLHYIKNRRKYREQQAKNKPIAKNIKRKLVQKYKSSNPCKDCAGFFEYYQMEFDHLDGYVKRNALNKIITENYSLEIIWTEIAKCDLLCGNCHRNRTYKRLLDKGIATKRGTVLYIQEYKNNQPCTDCHKIFDYWMLDFDHIPGSVKCGNVGEMVWYASLDRIKDEVDKCNLVCVNCHSKRSHIRKTWKVPLNGGQPVLKTGVV